MYISRNIKELRKLKNISQKELADILGVKNTVLSNWENNAYKPDIEMIIKLSDYFGVSVSDFVKNKIDEKYSFSVHNIENMNTDSKCKFCEEKERIIISKEETIEALKESNKLLKDYINKTEINHTETEEYYIKLREQIMKNDFL